MLGRIHQEADAAGVRITRFDPQAPVVYEKLRRVPVVVGCTGSFSQIYEFIRKLETMPTSVWVGALRMEKDVKKYEECAFRGKLGNICRQFREFRLRKTF